MRTLRSYARKKYVKRVKIEKPEKIIFECRFKHKHETDETRKKCENRSYFKLKKARLL